MTNDVILLTLGYLGFAFVFLVPLAASGRPLYSWIKNRPLRLAACLGLAAIWPLTLTLVVVSLGIWLFVDTAKGIMK